MKTAVILLPAGDDTSPAGGRLSEQIERILEPRIIASGYQTMVPERDVLQWSRASYDAHVVQDLMDRACEVADLVVSVESSLEGGDVVQGRFADKLIRVPASDVASSTAVVDLVNGPVSEVPERATSGIIDIGSQSVKLSLYSLSAGRSPALVHTERDSISIATSVNKTGSLDEEALSGLEEVLARFAGVASAAGAEVTSVATEAVRRAGNSSDVFSLVRRTTRADLRVISQGDEALLVGNAVRSVVRSTPGVAALNLGGSSVQIVQDVHHPEVTRLLYRFGTKDVVREFPWDRSYSSVRWGDLVEHVTSLIAGHGPAGAPVTATTLFHTGGELDFLLRCRVPLDAYYGCDRHVSSVSLASFEAFAGAFAALEPKEAADSTDLQPAWLSGALASNAIAIAVARHLGATVLVPSNLNVSDGLLLEAPT